MAKISVIVPVYKVEPYLRRCVDSILAQAYKDFELILVDDGSPDNCGTICDEYAAKDSRVIVIHQKNGGLSAARNAGIDWAFKNSNSEYLAFVDSDDWVSENYLAYLHSGILLGVKTSCVDCVVASKEQCAESVVCDCGWKVDSSRTYWLESGASGPFPMVAWGKLYAKDLFRQVRFPVGKIHEDEYTTYKVIFACDKIAFSESKLYYYFRREDSITGVKFSPQHLDIVGAHKDQLSFFAQLKDDELIRVSQHKLLVDYDWAIVSLGRNEYRSAMRHLVREMDLHFDGKYQQYCAVAFPIRFQLYQQYRRFYQLAKRGDWLVTFARVTRRMLAKFYRC